MWSADEMDTNGVRNGHIFAQRKLGRKLLEVNACDLLVTPGVVNLILDVFVVVDVDHHGRPL